MSKKKYKFNNFKVDVYTAPGMKTSTYTLINKKTGEEYGQIKWHSPTRQYCFHPLDDNRITLTCVAEISTLMNEILAGRKKIGNN